MPSSSKYTITPVLEAIEQINPKSVLDVGIGFGKWGFLLRESLEIFRGHNNPYAHEGKLKWSLKIDGVEVFDRYITDVQRNIYDQIIIGDIRFLIDRLNNYDLILLGDVIEHFTKAEGLALLRKCYDKCNMAVLITTPIHFFPQKDKFANIFEMHKSLWTRRDFKHYKHAQFCYNRGSLVIVLSKAGQKIKMYDTYRRSAKILHDVVARQQSMIIEKHGIGHCDDGFLLRLYSLLKKFKFKRS